MCVATSTYLVGTPAGGGEEARARARDKQETATVEGEMAMLAAQLAAIRGLRR